MGLLDKLFKRGGDTAVAEPPEELTPATPVISEADQAHAREAIERELEEQRAKMAQEGGTPPPN